MLRALNGAKQAVVRISDDIHGSPDECEDCEDCDDAFGNCSRHDDCPYIDDMTVDEIRDKIDSEIAAAANYIDSILKERAL
jgi:multimeric flavodoxin WrbA